MPIAFRHFSIRPSQNSIIGGKWCLVQESLKVASDLFGKSNYVDLRKLLDVAKLLLNVKGRLVCG